MAVVGEFKAGKSTLINALLGQELLPVAARECTSVVTALREPAAGEVSGVTLSREDGTTLETTFERLAEVLTVSSAPLDGSPVVQAEVRVAGSPWLTGGVCLVDTPGAGAAFLAREIGMLDYLPRADAIVFLSRADALLGESEMEFLTRRVVPQDAVRPFIAINHADRIPNDRERRDLLDRACDRLAPVLGSSPRVFFLSAQDALEARLAGDLAACAASGVAAFECALRAFLEEDRAVAELDRHAAAVDTLRNDLVRAIEQRRFAASLDAEQTLRRRTRLQEAILLMRRDGEGLQTVVNESFDALKRGPLVQELAACERAAQSVFEKFGWPDADDERAPERLRALADGLGGRAQTRLLGLFRDEVERIHRDLVTRLQDLFDTVDRDLSPPGQTILALRSLDFGALVQVRTVTEVVPDRVERIERVEPPDDSDRRLVAGGIAGFIGLFLGGPVGALFGAGIGWGLAGRQSYTRKVYDTIHRTVGLPSPARTMAPRSSGRWRPGARSARSHRLRPRWSPASSLRCSRAMADLPLRAPVTGG